MGLVDLTVAQRGMKLGDGRFDCCTERYEIVVLLPNSEQSRRSSSTLKPIFSLFGGNERIKIQLKLGHHRPASGSPYKWRFTGGPIMHGPTLNAGLVYRESGRV